MDLRIDLDIVFWSRADKIPPSVYATYRQACATAEKEKPESENHNPCLLWLWASVTWSLCQWP